MLSFNDISLNLYFTTLQPLEFTEVDKDIQDKETIEEETGVESNGEVVISEDIEPSEVEKVDASYNGAQISSAIAIIEKVKEGILTSEQAKTFLIQFLQLPESIANSFFDNDTINLSKIRNYLETKKFSLKKIDGQEAYNTKEEAEIKAKEIGCSGSHEMEIEGDIYFMPCENHTELKEPCWDGYEQIGMKDKDGKQVPNCVPLSREKLCCSSDSTEDDEKVASKLIALGEDIDEEKWEAIFEQDVDYQKEDAIDNIITELGQNEYIEESKRKLSTIQKIVNLVSTGSAYPNSPSAQDKKVGENYFKVRYFYSPRKVGSNARSFCRAMKNANKLYRKKDIIAMGTQTVNKGWGPEGADQYSIWLYKGGGNCHHSWRRVTYKSKLSETSTKDIQNIIGTRQAAILGYKVTNPYQVSIQPRNLPNKGFLPNNPQGK
jgi:hypothetical protein